MPTYKVAILNELVGPELNVVEFRRTSTSKTVFLKIYLGLWVGAQSLIVVI